MEKGEAQVGDHVRGKTDADDLVIRGLEGEVLARSTMGSTLVCVRFAGNLFPLWVPPKDVLVIERPEKRQRRMTEQAKTERTSQAAERRIIQLLPADGWWAVFADWRAGPVEIKWELLVAWALVEEGPHQRFEGILAPDAGSVNYAEDKRRLLPFLQYLHNTQNTPTNTERLKDMARRQREYERFRRIAKGEEG